MGSKPRKPKAFRPMAVVVPVRFTRADWEHIRRAARVETTATRRRTTGADLIRRGSLRDADRVFRVYGEAA